MLANIAMVSAAAAALELDSVQIGQFMISRPSVAGAIIGILGGDFIAGLQLGLCLELLTIDQVPVGGSIPPNGVIGVACAFSLHHYFGFDSGYSFLLGLALGGFYEMAEMKMRTARALWNAPMDAEVSQNPGALPKWLFKAFAQQAAVAFVFALAGIYAMGYFGEAAWLLIPAKIKPAFYIAYRMAPWLGLAALAAALLPKKGSEDDLENFSALAFHASRLE